MCQNGSAVIFFFLFGVFRLRLEIDKSRAVVTSFWKSLLLCFNEYNASFVLFLSSDKYALQCYIYFNSVDLIKNHIHLFSLNDDS